ncbi:MAG: hypothetical protein QOH60_1508 [Mycobacterium sp.]|jgi:hypothetical protein|nr:hypothetical protein [Mycobacterium sp.]
MTTQLRLRGTWLRYVLTHHLSVHGPATVAELIEMLEYHGFTTKGRPSKVISDALRWEIGHDRVRRRGRGLYFPGPIPRSTEYRIHQRVLALRAEARQLSLLYGQNDTCSADVTDGTEGAGDVDPIAG